jgi:predicted GH43/DUF377 family glycosyl hydrolase
MPANRGIGAVPEEHDRRLIRNLWWIRDAANPVLPPGGAESFDAACAMNPCALRKGDEYHLYYAGGDAQGRRRICLATVPVEQVSDPRAWTRHGPLFDVGAPGSFDARWCVLPHVVQVADDRWHLYYTGRSDHGEGLSAFPGLGLAISRDSVRWEKYEGNPILAPTHRAGDPDRMGMAGGSVLQAWLRDGTAEWRYYYTGCPTLGEDLFLNQQKVCCLAVSRDGVRWERRGPVLFREPDRDYENVAAAGPVVRQEPDGAYRMWYSAIGTRWGYYSICYAESEDGIHWRRGGAYGDNLQLGPVGTGWERQMVEYPSVLPDAATGRLRLFYCGNGYGGTGIGTAVASPLRATPEQGTPSVRVVAADRSLDCTVRLPEYITCDGQPIFTGDAAAREGGVRWHGPDASGTYWHEWRTAPGREGLWPGLQYRVLITPAADGLRVRCTLINAGRDDLPRIAVTALAESTGDAASGSPGVAIAWDAADGVPAADGAGRATIDREVLPAGETYTLRATIALAGGT